MAETPRGSRVYAIGDIHGQHLLLQALLTAIHSDINRDPPERAVLICLGDYVDRGPGVREVVELLSEQSSGALQTVFLKGNHEAMMLATMQGDRHQTAAWVANGGRETLACYGVTVLVDDLVSRDDLDTRGLKSIGHALYQAMPDRDKDFFATLNLFHQEGGYTFVHAGIRPGVPIKDQDPQDLMWIRYDFLDSPTDHGTIVVHGHTPKPAPDIRANRIGIDTGAYKSGILTCLVLEGTSHRFIQSHADRGILAF